MFDKKELALIIGALIDTTISIKYELSEGKYVCVEEAESMFRKITKLENLSNKVSNLLNN